MIKIITLTAISVVCLGGCARAGRFPYAIEGELLSETPTEVVIKWSLQNAHDIPIWVPTMQDREEATTIEPVGFDVGVSDKGSLVLLLGHIHVGARKTWTRAILDPKHVKVAPGGTYSWVVKLPIPYRPADESWNLFVDMFYGQPPRDERVWLAVEYWLYPPDEDRSGVEELGDSRSASAIRRMAIAESLFIGGYYPSGDWRRAASRIAVSEPIAVDIKLRPQEDDEKPEMFREPKETHSTSEELFGS